ncbi:hypothetical protein CAPTEDRAFT_229344 [Capitella teleta]|uniref:Carboxylesterase type B domain-containing protein n=1 Tax=Capitella teleta TaxID=283909 RepID=R7TS12_CAPTE|nr:hypothetical protein CAPTEDRAFT_229344 [Capitella teleta]|eukprot:ELT96372.1 hypothetical protein CAPTEDRAFT_229344 [Capitella teleta]
MRLLYLLLFLLSSSGSTSLDPGYSGLEEGDAVSDVIIQTKVGGIQGLVVNSSGVLSTRFLGVPYARPPIGDLRFAMPQRHPGWAVRAPLRATEYRFACYQDMDDLKAKTADAGYRRRLDKVLMSEDCLYLNMYVPLNMSDISHLNTRSMPVMVFLHGGGFQGGTAIPFEGWRLACHNNVIVVSVEYRVGVFGFLSTRNSAAPGNLGLWDQRHALHWIWDNIREIGGSPESITVFGEDAGAMSAGFHVVSPQSRGLLSRVIMQSGSMISPSAIQKTPITIATTLANTLRCPVANSTHMIDCLQRISAHALQSASSGHDWLPIVDGKFLPDSPRALLQQGKFNWVDAIIGVRQEPLETSPPLVFSQFEAELKEGAQSIYLAQQQGGRFEEFYAAVLLEYAFCEDTTHAPLLSDFRHDAFTVAPSVEAARHLSRSDKKVFFYSFDLSEDELSFVFGENDGGLFQKAVMDAWSNFAQTGDPNPVNDRGIHWRPYNEIQRHYVTLNQVLDKRSMHQDPWPRACAFWNEYVPHVLSAKNRRWGSQCSGQELCSSLVGSVRSPDRITTAAMWTLTGTCVILLLVLVALSALCCLRYDCCRRRPSMQPMDDISRTPIYATPTKNQNSLRRKHLKQNTPNGSETRRLHPLPYCDET